VTSLKQHTILPLNIPVTVQAASLESLTKKNFQECWCEIFLHAVFLSVTQPKNMVEGRSVTMLNLINFVNN